MGGEMAGELRAWGWVDALRAGGTVGWTDWTEPAAAGAATTTRPGRLPGAQQLALLLKLNRQAAATSRSIPVGLADRVLVAGAAGRGRADLALEGVDVTGFGPRPVDPERLDAAELLRVAAGLLADDVAIHPVPQRSTVDRARRASHRWRRLVQPFVVVGSPLRADAARADLGVQGHPSGGRRPTAYLLAPDLATLLVDAWTVRSFDQGGAPWGRFVSSSAGSGGLPPRADLPGMARSAAQRYGASRVVVVTDLDALADALGVPSIAGPVRLGADAVDLVRRVGDPLGLLVDHDRRPELLQSALLGRLEGRGGPSPTVPTRWSGWLAAQAERARHDLAAAGYPVLGDLDALLPPAQPTHAVGPVDDEVLALALDLLLDPIVERA